MANIMKPPPEPRAPLHPKDASLPGYAQQPRKSYGWVGIVVAIVVLAWALGSVLIALGIGYAVSTYGGQTIMNCTYFYRKHRLRVSLSDHKGCQGIASWSH